MLNTVSDVSEVKELAKKAVTEAIGNAFLTMLGVSAEIGEASLSLPSSSAQRTVASVIGWVGAWNGTGILECTPECACMIANLMLGTEDGALNEDSLDAVAEMANIVFGGMKTELESSLGSMGLSTPTVIYGNNVGMRSGGEAFTVIPFKVDGHTIAVKLHITRAEERRNPLNHFWAPILANA